MILETHFEKNLLFHFQPSFFLGDFWKNIEKFLKIPNGGLKIKSAGQNHFLVVIFFYGLSQTRVDFFQGIVPKGRLSKTKNVNKNMIHSEIISRKKELLCYPVVNFLAMH